MTAEVIAFARRPQQGLVPAAGAPIRRMECSRLLCLAGLAPCKTEWLGGQRSQLWLVCSDCGKPRTFLGAAGEDK